jgi:hypothetical protein
MHLRKCPIHGLLCGIKAAANICWDKGEDATQDFRGQPMYGGEDASARVIMGLKGMSSGLHLIQNALQSVDLFIIPR